MNSTSQEKLVRAAAVLLIMLFALQPLRGQSDVSPSMLFRGRLAERYPSKFNGTPYWDTLSFRKGTVMYNGLLYEDVLMKVDAVGQKLVVKMDETAAATSPDTRQVEWFRIGTDLFVNLHYQGITDAPDGFFVREKPGNLSVPSLLTDLSSHLYADGILSKEPVLNCCLRRFRKLLLPPPQICH